MIIGPLAELREYFGTRSPGGAADYRLCVPFGPGYTAVSREGVPSFVIPLAEVPTGVTRTGGGCCLRPAPALEFDYGGRRWRQAAAILESTDPELFEPYLVLVCDLGRRLDAGSAPVSWREVIEVVDEWQSLLAARAPLSLEVELGLWGELTFILRADDADRLFRAWRGPEGSPVDFIVDGVGIEVKTSRTRLSHFVSQAQVDDPLGTVPTYFVSMWVGLDPSAGETLDSLVERLMKRTSEPADVMRKLLKAGYQQDRPTDHGRPFALLESWAWFDMDAVPRVRAADPGVSRLRYLVELDDSKQLTRSQADALHDRILGAAALSPPAER